MLTAQSPPGFAPPSRKPRPLKAVGPYRLVKTIGQGSTGKVKLAIHEGTMERLACKIMILPDSLQHVSRETDITHITTLEGLSVLVPDQSFQKTNQKDYDKAVRLVREATIMMLLHHPHIVSLHQISICGHFLYFFFDYVSGAQLLDYIISHGKLKEKHARRFIRQIISAVDYCHQNQIVHRDLKIENILIDKDGQAKLIDFGLSNYYTSDSLLSTYCGSLYFASPELLNGRPYVGPKVDVWSLGVILYVLVCGKVPFDDPKIPTLHAKIKTGKVEYPSFLSAECRHILSRMIVVDAESRASMDEIKRDEWINKGFECLPDSYKPRSGRIESIDRRLLDCLRSSFGPAFKTLVAPLEDPSIHFNDLSLEMQEKYSVFHIYHLLLDYRKRHESNVTAFTTFSEDTLNQESQMNVPAICIYPDEVDDIGNEQMKRLNVADDDDVINFTIEDGNEACSIPIGIPIMRRNNEVTNQMSYSMPQRSYMPSANRWTPITPRLEPARPEHSPDMLSKSVPASSALEDRRMEDAQSIHSTHEPGRFDDGIRAISLKGLFSVSNTSSKKPSIIRDEILKVLSRMSVSHYEYGGGFECHYSPVSDGPPQSSPRMETIPEDKPVVNSLSLPRIFSRGSVARPRGTPHVETATFDSLSKRPKLVVFEINIVRIPLLGLHGIKFRRIAGDPWEVPFFAYKKYKKTCTRILQHVRL